VSVDAAELELALINLSLNARHAMPGGGRLEIAARNEDADTIAVSVSDTGVGIPPAVLPHVFEPFYTTRAQEAGSGLGLSQVQGFCAQAGGSVRLSSTVGVGTQVELLLPAQTVRSLVAAAAEPAFDAPLRGRLLLVEDNEDVATSTAAILQAAGLEVAHLASADAALAALRSGAQRPDIVLTDIEMPGTLSGMDLAFRLREERPGLPVVLITGYAKRLDDAVSGGLRVLPKPTRAAELLRELRDALQHSATGQPPR
jgi:two-component system NtrC family sensor kinase